MNMTVFASNDNAFINCGHITGIAYKNAVSWVNCALLPVICDIFVGSQDNCAHFNRIERLSPQRLPA